MRLSSLSFASRSCVFGFLGEMGRIGESSARRRGGGCAVGYGGD